MKQYALIFATVFLAVLVGAQLGAWISPRHLRTIAALAFIAIGIWMLATRA